MAERFRNHLGDGQRAATPGWASPVSILAKWRALSGLAVLLSAILAALGAHPARAQRIQAEAGAYYQPPILPIQFNIDSSGRLSISASGVFVTPFGTFGVGGGIAAVPRARNNVCFIVRRRGQESVYCIGTNGKLRLTTVGTSIVDISGYPGRPNVYLIDVLKERGQFSVHFVPSPGANELARIRLSLLEHVYLRRDGAIVLDGAGDIVYPRRAVRRAALYETGRGPYFEAIFVIVSVGPKGEYRYHRWPISKENVIETRWLLQMLATVAPGTARYERPVQRFGPHAVKVALFPDGSIFDGLQLYYGGHIAGLQLNRYDPANVELQIKPQFALAEAKTFGMHAAGFSNAAEAIRFIRLYRHHFGPRR